MIKTFAVNIKESLEPEEFKRLCHYVSVGRREKVNRFLKYEDRLRSLLADLTIRYALFAEYGINNQEIQFTFNDYGKPRIENLNHIYFNVSHSGDWVVCSIGDMEVGVDVEKISKADFDIVKRFFASIEVDAFSKLSEEERKTFFYELWTAKESYIKAVGKGMNIPLDSFSVLNYSVEKTDKCKELTDGWTLKPLKLDEGYRLTVCSKSHDITEQVNLLPIQRLIDFFKDTKLG